MIIVFGYRDSGKFIKLGLGCLSWHFCGTLWMALLWTPVGMPTVWWTCLWWTLSLSASCRAFSSTNPCLLGQGPCPRPSEVLSFPPPPNSCCASLLLSCPQLPCSLNHLGQFLFVTWFEGRREHPLCCCWLGGDSWTSHRGTSKGLKKTDSVGGHRTVTRHPVSSSWPSDLLSSTC